MNAPYGLAPAPTVQRLPTRAPSGRRSETVTAQQVLPPTVTRDSRALTRCPARPVKASRAAPAEPPTFSVTGGPPGTMLPAAGVAPGPAAAGVLPAPRLPAAAAVPAVAAGCSVDAAAGAVLC